MIPSRNPNAGLHLADALAEQIKRTPHKDLLAEATEDFGDTQLLTNEFDAAFVRARRQYRRQKLIGRITAFASAIMVPPGLRVAAAAAVLMIVSGATLLHLRSSWTWREPEREAKQGDRIRELDAEQTDAARRAQVEEALKALHVQFEGLRQAGNWSEAKIAAERQLVLVKAAYGGEHPKYAAGLLDLAEAFKGPGDLASAESALKEGLGIVERVSGREHPDVAAFLQRLASVYTAENRPNDAIAMLRRGLDVAEKSLGREHPEVARQRGELESLLIRTAEVERTRAAERRLAEERRMAAQRQAVAQGRLEVPVVATLHDGRAAVCCVFSDDGKQLAVFSERAVRVMRIDGAIVRDELTAVLDEPPIGVTFGGSPRILTLGSGNMIRTRDKDGRLLRSEGPYPQILGLRSSQEGFSVLVRGQDNSLKVFREGKEQLALSGQQAPVQWAAFSADGALIVAAADSRVRVWSGVTGAPASPSIDAAAMVRYATLSRDGRQIAVVVGDRRSISVWEVGAGRQVFSQRKPGPAIRSVEFDADGRQLLTTYEDGKVRLLNLENSAVAEVRGIHSDQVASATFAPDGRSVAVVLRDGTVRVLPAAEGGNCSVATCFGAVVEKNGGIFARVEEPSAADAEAAALRTCEKSSGAVRGCRLIARISDTECWALAEVPGKPKNIRAAVGKDKATAADNAIQDCQKAFGVCQIAISICAGGGGQRMSPLPPSARPRLGPMGGSSAPPITSGP